MGVIFAARILDGRNDLGIEVILLSDFTGEFDPLLLHDPPPQRNLELVRRSLVVRHWAVLRGRPRFLGVSSLSTSLARLATHSAKYAAKSSGCLTLAGNVSLLAAFLRRTPASGSCFSSTSRISPSA